MGQTCDEVCAGHGQVCEAGHLYPIQNETEVKKTAAMAGFTCTHYYRETWSSASGMGLSSVWTQASAFTMGTRFGSHLVLRGLLAATGTGSALAGHEVFTGRPGGHKQP